MASAFQNGYWTWDDHLNGLSFFSRDVRETVPGLGAASTATQQSKRDVVGTLRFKNTVDTLGMAKFRRLFQRRIKPNEPQIVVLQDIKDVALFTAERNDLTPEFIDFIHTRRMDEFLRTLIVYFQYYFHVWENLILRREEAERKLRQPIVTVLEDAVRDNLADLRSMVSRNYGYIILGTEDTFKYYHMSNRNNVSLSDKDRHLHEGLLSIAARILWIAFLRKNFTIIGKACTSERKLKHRSPAVQELIFDDHCYKMLALGHLRVEPFEERMAYLEVAYTAPEELLFEIGIGVGILGLSKEYLNPILMPNEGMAKRIKIPPFKLPEMETLRYREVVGETLAAIPPSYTETEQAAKIRLTQCKLWRRYVAGLQTRAEEVISINMESISSHPWSPSMSNTTMNKAPSKQGSGQSAHAM